MFLFVAGHDAPTPVDWRHRRSRAEGAGITSGGWVRRDFAAVRGSQLLPSHSRGAYRGGAVGRRPCVSFNYQVCRDLAASVLVCWRARRPYFCGLTAPTKWSLRSKDHEQPMGWNSQRMVRLQRYQWKGNDSQHLIAPYFDKIAELISNKIVELIWIDGVNNKTNLDFPHSIDWLKTE